jgi:hypothetical protein
MKQTKKNLQKKNSNKKTKKILIKKKKSKKYLEKKSLTKNEKSEKERILEMVNFYLKERMQNNLPKTSSISFGYFPNYLFEELFGNCKQKSSLVNYNHNGDKRKIEQIKIMFSNLKKDYGKIEKIPSFLKNVYKYKDLEKEKYKSKLLSLIIYYNLYTEFIVFKIYYVCKIFSEKDNCYKII